MTTAHKQHYRTIESPKMKCFCGTDQKFENCCQPFITKKSSPMTAEQLMRSRYTAFCNNCTDYLIATHWPIDRPNQASIQKSIDNTEWIGLKIIATDKGLGTDEQGEVEFVAFFSENGIKQLHERSRFVKKDGRWYYRDGQQLPSIKLNRNEICFCGSEKKFKKCHGQYQ